MNIYCLFWYGCDRKCDPTPQIHGLRSPILRDTIMAAPRVTENSASQNSVETVSYSDSVLLHNFSQNSNISSIVLSNDTQATLYELCSDADLYERYVWLCHMLSKITAYKRYTSLFF